MNADAPSHLVTASVLFTNSQDRVLIVHPARPGAPWTLPGGRAEVGESPVDAAQREVREELGIEVDLQPQDLLMVEWLEATRPGRRARLAFIFEGPRLSRADTRNIVLQVSELDAWTWATREAAFQALHPRIAQRVQVSLQTTGSTLYREIRNERTPAR